MQITEEQVIQTLRDVVAERPEYVYQRPERMADQEIDGGAHGCYYVHTAEDGETLCPGCVAGHVFVRLGVEPPELRAFEGNSADYVLRELFGLDEASPAGVMLAAAQERQDGGDSWADALTAADLLVAELESGE